MPSSPEPGLAQSTSNALPQYPDRFWRSLFYFNLYRITIACVFVLSTIFFSNASFGTEDQPLYYKLSGFYILFGIAFLATIQTRRPSFNLQLTGQVCVDIFFIVMLMYTSGGMRSGLGVLLLASLAAGGLISRGRRTLFHASLASLALLLEQTYRVVFIEPGNAQFVQAGLLSMGFFAIAWLAHMLAKYTLASEQLAMQRGIDLANLAQVNRQVIQDMQDGVLVVDSQKKVRQRNTQADRLLGWVHRNLKEPNLKELSEDLSIHFEEWIASGKTNFSPIRTHPNNKMIRTRFVPVNDNRSAGALIFLEDMSRVQAQAQQLKLAALGRLTANIAHEIRNPLSAINHATELLQEEPADVATTRLLGIIHDNAHRLDNMVKEVLELNRRDRAQPEALNLRKTLSAFVEEFAAIEKIPLDSIALTITDGKIIYFDQSHLNQVLWNLCRNAWRHCRQQSGSVRLNVSLGYSENVVKLDVLDDGTGVAPDLHNQLFEPFFTTDARGTGLGLYIARELAEANDASLDYIDTTTSGGHFRIIFKGS